MTYTPGSSFPGAQDNYFTQVKMQQVAADNAAAKAIADADMRARMGSASAAQLNNSRQAAADNAALKARADADMRARMGSASSAKRTNQGTRFQDLLNRLKALQTR